VLVVDADPAVRDLLADVARSLDCQVVAAATAADARRAIAKVSPVHVLVTDVALPDGDGLDLLAALRKRNPAARRWSSPATRAWRRRRRRSGPGPSTSSPSRSPSTRSPPASARP
jgi:CheY-like chemotaxis protein